MAERSDAAVLLNETGHFLDSGTAQEQLGAAVHNLTTGSFRRRKYEEHVPNYRFLYISSSNSTIAEVLKKITRRRRKAAEVRLLTVNAEYHKELGIFNSLPRGCTTSVEPIEQISELANTHYGWAAKEFIHRLEVALADPRQGKRLHRNIERYVAEFRDHAGTAARGNEGTFQRAVAKFAVIYAAGMLGRRWRILPLDYVGSAVLAVFNRFRQSFEGGSEEVAKTVKQVGDYFRQHESKLYVIDDGKYRRLNDRQFDEAPGFLRHQGGVTWLIVSPERWAGEFGGRARSMLGHLSGLDRLKATDGYQWQVKVRQSKDRTESIVSALRRAWAAKRRFTSLKHEPASGQ